MLVMVVMNGRAFMQRKCLDLALEERQETVSLLLREFESSDADWLWQTNAKLTFQNVSARFARAIGRQPEELEGTSFIDLLRSVRRGDQRCAAPRRGRGRDRPREPITELSSRSRSATR
jgi:PAS domain-containing protein